MTRFAAGSGLAAMLVMLGSETLQTAAANGDTRTISFRNTHTSEELTVTYKRDGRYVPEAMKQVNHILRDWRRDEATTMDPRLIDTVWEVHRELNAKAPIWIISGYRSPNTNNMLRKRSSGVAENSQHTHGRAMDFFIPGVPLADIRAMGLRMQRGGVGFYPTSGSPFVHLDVGSVRHWPRMTYDQLARVFPDGRTVHIPSNGKPLPGYQLALADMQRRGGASSRVAVASAGDNAATNSAPIGSLIASLFNGGETSPAQTVSTPAAAPRPAAPKAEPSTVLAAAVPLPMPAPAGRVQLASATPVAAMTSVEVASAAPVRLPPPRPAARQANTLQMAAASVLPLPASRTGRTQQAAGAKPMLTASAIIESRGYWQGPAEPEQARIVQAKLAQSQMAQNQMAQAVTQNPPQNAVSAAARKAPRGALPAPKPPELPALMRGERGEFSDLAMAYAPHNEPPGDPVRPRQTAAKAPVVTTAATVPANTTVAAKRTKNRASTTIVSAAVPAAAVTRVGDRLDNPWMRAMVVSPGLRTGMSIAALGTLDPRHLAPLMAKPGTAVASHFSEDSETDLSADRFTGEAVVFVRTVTFAALRRDAALR